MKLLDIEVKKDMEISSLKISNILGKPHRIIYDKILRLVEELENNQLNDSDYFNKTSFTNYMQREFQSFNLTKKGFVLLALYLNYPDCIKSKIDLSNKL